MAEEQPDWLQAVLDDAATKRESESGLTPPPVSQVENDFLNVSEEEKTRRFKRGNMIIVLVIILQIIALMLVIYLP